jgi:hypothetical protein
MGYQFEFDPVNKLLLLRFEGRLTEELVADIGHAAQEHWAATDAKMGIADFSKATEVAISTEFLRQFANREPAGDTAKYPRVVVAPNTLQFGLARMFQVVGERTRPSLHVVRTMNEAFDTLGVQSPHFDPLE